MERRFSVVVDEQYGFRRLDPLPRPEDFESFYREQYYDLVPEGGRANELRRLIGGGLEAQVEHDWLSRTMWDDIATGLDEQLPKGGARRLLDIGCGPGHFSRFMASRGWDVVGIEPSTAAAHMAVETGLRIYETIEACLAEQAPFDAATMLNVAEHVFDPVGLIRGVAPALRTGGLLTVRVPNDFTPLQDAAIKALGKEPWWIAPPDHVNYFTFESLRRVFEANGYRVVDEIGDFPMELFLLLGDDYIGKPEVGSACHRRRRKLELALPSELRRSMYRSLAASGIARNCLVFGRLESRP